MSNPVLAVAPYLLAASQISRAAADIMEGFNAGTMTQEQAQARWQEASDAVTRADARWVKADQAARGG